MTREEHPSDRRRVRLGITRRGHAVLEDCTQGTLAHLSGKLSCVEAEDREVIVRAMQTLRSVFTVDTRARTVAK